MSGRRIEKIVTITDSYQGYKIVKSTWLKVVLIDFVIVCGTQKYREAFQACFSAKRGE